MIDQNTQAARAFYEEVSRFSRSVKPWQPSIFYEVKPNEINDITLISKNVYGNRDEVLAVMAAANIRATQTITQKTIVLPTGTKLDEMKRKTGFESIASQRANFKPLWAK